MDERLEKWKDVFKKAVNFDFIHLTSNEFNEIASLYTQYVGKTITKSQMNCNSCRLKIVKELGQRYLEMEQEEIKNNQSQEEAQNAKKAKRDKGGKVTRRTV